MRAPLHVFRQDAVHHMARKSPYPCACSAMGNKRGSACPTQSALLAASTLATITHLGSRVISSDNHSSYSKVLTNDGVLKRLHGWAARGCSRQYALVHAVDRHSTSGAHPNANIPSFYAILHIAPAYLSRPSHAHVQWKECPANAV